MSHSYINIELHITIQSIGLETSAHVILKLELSELIELGIVYCIAV